MKAIYTFALAAGVAIFASCGESTTAVESQAPAAPAVAEATSTDYFVTTSASTVTWAGTKIIGGGHNGTVGILKGKFTVVDSTISSGMIMIDMNTIANTDLEDEEQRANLVGHLSSPDFFDAATHPYATFTVTKHAEGQLAGNLELKGVSREISFPIRMSELDGKLAAKGSVVINRTEWGVEYGSSLGDATLGDNMEIGFNLEASTEMEAAK